MIEKDWNVSSGWSRIHSDWNLKRLTDSKGFKRIKKSFRMRLGFIRIRIDVSSAWFRIYSDYTHADWGPRIEKDWKESFGFIWIEFGVHARI